MLRLFVAVLIPENVKQVIAAAIEPLRQERDTSCLRWSRPEQIHFTLKFLGGVPESQLDNIKAALQKQLREATGFTLQPNGVGSFGNRRFVRAVWVGLDGEAAKLVELAENIEQALNPLGYPREKKCFAPHLTIARVQRDANIKQHDALRSVLEQFTPPKLPAFTVDRVSLMQSTLNPKGSIYEEIAKFPLKI
ncbi:MAG TPA: RNA 2',3'-cyclic phosphodiesterase [Bdellovibrionota bacterium]|nr:RNA 2',3'-cyclic phosphodiesterase [Bdellovibrionota bacterium]